MYNKGTWAVAFEQKGEEGLSKGTPVSWAPFGSSSKKCCQSALKCFVRSALEPISNPNEF